MPSYGSVSDFRLETEQSGAKSNEFDDPISTLSIKFCYRRPKLVSRTLYYLMAMF